MFADLTDKTSIDYLMRDLKHAPDKPYLFHLGAQAHVGESWHRPYETVMANTVGTLNLLQSVVDHGVELEKFDTAGTSEEYGNVRESVAHHHDFDEAGSLILHERSPINPKSIYATAKVAADFLTMNYHDAYGLPGVVTRMFNNYGPRQNPRYVTGTVITQALEREVIELGALDPLRDFCFCTDGVRGHLTVAAHGTPGRRLRLRPGREHLDGRLGRADPASRRGARLLARRPPRSRRRPKRFRPGASEVMALRVGYDKLQRETGWTPKVSVGERRRPHDRVVRGQPRQMDRPGRLAEPLALGSADGASRNRGRLAAELAALALIVAAHVWLLTRLLHTRTVLRRGRLPREPRRAAPRGGARPRGLHLAGARLLRGAAGDRLTSPACRSRRPGWRDRRIDAVGDRLRLPARAGRLGGPARRPARGGADRGRPDAAASSAGGSTPTRRDGARAGRALAGATRRSFAAGAVFAAAVSVKLSAVTAAPTLRRAARARAAPAAAAAHAAAGAATVVAVLALVFVRDLRGIWDGAFALPRRRGGHRGARNGAHQLANLCVTSLTRRSSGYRRRARRVGAVWRRVWPLWLWPAATCVRAPVPAAAGQPPDPGAVRVRGRRASRSGSRRPGCRGARSVVAAACVVLVLGAGWTQQLHRADEAREPETPALVAAAARLEQLTRPGDLVAADQPIVAVLAHRRVPPDLVDTASSRFLSGSLTDADVLAAIDRDPRVTAAVVGRAFADRPQLLTALRARFEESTSVDSVLVLHGRRSDAVSRRARRYPSPA